jgi:undecaprenyl-diphosphatase
VGVAAVVIAGLVLLKRRAEKKAEAWLDGPEADEPAASAESTV